MKHLYIPLLLSALLSSCDDAVNKQPISLHPENPHYFLYKEKPAVLITSGEHYGAVINLHFDYVTYLRTLASDGLNMTRVFSGAYVEPIGAFKIEGNTLAPAPEGFICPWARSEIPGYANGGNKFDLSKWDAEYFKRLKAFMSEAAKRDIIVEFTLFCPFYGDEQWNLSPMNATNNINGGVPKDRTHVYTLDKSNGLLAVQEALVRKLVRELKDYSNLIYEICNEPYFGGVTIAWQQHIANVIISEERQFTHPHLISQNIANGSAIIGEPHPAISVFNFHYANPPIAVTRNYHLNKVIGDNETGFRGNDDSTYRKEGWAFIVAGGALYNNLDYSFTTDYEDGTFRYPPTQPGGGSDTLRRQLGHLLDFINSFDYLKMKPDTSVIQNRESIRNVQVLAQRGKQYAIYIGEAGPVALDLLIPPGTYNVRFVDPRTGKPEKARQLTSNGILSIVTPAYREDIGVRIIRHTQR